MFIIYNFHDPKVSGSDSVSIINADGIQYSLEMLQDCMDEENKNTFLNTIETKMETYSGNDISDLEEL